MTTEPQKTQDEAQERVAVSSTRLLDMIIRYIERHGYSDFCEVFGAFAENRDDNFVQSCSNVHHTTFGWWHKWKHYNGWSSRRCIINPEF